MWRFLHVLVSKIYLNHSYWMSWICLYDDDMNLFVWWRYEFVCKMMIWICLYDDDMNLFVQWRYEFVCMMTIWICLYDDDMNLFVQWRYEFVCMMMIWICLHDDNMNLFVRWWYEFVCTMTIWICLYDDDMLPATDWELGWWNQRRKLACPSRTEQQKEIHRQPAIYKNTAKCMINKIGHLLSKHVNILWQYTS